MLTRGKRIFGLLASILEYPSPGINSQIDKSIAFLALLNPEAKLHLDQFRGFCSDNPLSRLEEIHRKTFDLDAPCSPYVGHHLFNYDRSRMMFQARLRRRRYPGIPSRNPHPDHIADMLRSLIVQESVEEARELAVCCLVPALRKMISRLEDNGNPYQSVLQAVLLTLEAMDTIRCAVA
jgi:nitrate reductase assembly molybdenum cofactor insertion protein NarJ